MTAERRARTFSLVSGGFLKRNIPHDRPDALNCSLRRADTSLIVRLGLGKYDPPGGPTKDKHFADATAQTFKKIFRT